MVLIIGVRFRKSGKVYYFDPTGFDIQKGDHVIVETARGIEYGLVVLSPKEVTDDKIVQPLKPIIRVATPEDDATSIENEEKEKEAYRVCLEKIRNHQLDMKLIDSEYTFDRNKLLFYFTADGRIDFRELVKDLASVFRTRIELRQIGVRDETKMIGGIAICGRPLCCHTFLSDFAPVSIKMAKEQNLSLNPSKISGVCGRLMCCLKNEEEAYEYLNKNLPHIGAKVKTSEGYDGEVQSVGVLKQRVKVLFTNEHGDKEVREYHVSEITFENNPQGEHFSRGHILPEETLDENALKELEQLEKADLDSEAELNNEKNNTRKKKAYPKNNGNKNNFNSNKGNHEGKKEHNAKNNYNAKNTHRNYNANSSHRNSSRQNKNHTQEL